MRLSIKKTLDQSTILLTGGLGGVGSTCLEQLLRQTQVKTIFLLVRGKGKHTAQERVTKLLCSPLFHQMHQQAQSESESDGPEGVNCNINNPFARVCVVEGDLEQQGLGLCDDVRQQLLSEVDVVLHCAADLALEAHIQRTLRANYCGTRRLLELCAGMPRLCSFAYVSTYYVNNFLHHNAHVKEEVHRGLPLTLSGDSESRLLTHCQLVDQLLSFLPDTAAAEAAVLMSRLNFASTYAFGKMLTEQMVDDPGCLPAGVAKAIVRPSLVYSMAGAPYPGYCTGLSGAPSYTLCYGAGFYHSIQGVAYTSDAWIDLIPVDIVSSLIIAAAAAAAAAAVGKGAQYLGGRAKVYHAASAASHPFSVVNAYQAMHDFWTDNCSPARLPFARLPTFSGPHTPTLRALRWNCSLTGWKVWLAAKLLQLAGRSRQAAALLRGFRTFQVQNTPGLSRSFVCLVDNARELQASLSEDEAGRWCCVWAKDSCMDWDTYTTTAQTGLYCLAFKAPVSSVTTPIPHHFKKREGLSDTSLMQQWLTADSNDSSSSSTSATVTVLSWSDQDTTTTASAAPGATGVDKSGVPLVHVTAVSTVEMPVVVSAVSSEDDDAA